MKKLSKFQINETLLAGIAVFLLICVILLTKVDFSSSSFKCPKEYATYDDYLDGIDEWGAQELLKNPNITKEELLETRGRLFDKYKCEKFDWNLETAPRD